VPPVVLSFPTQTVDAPRLSRLQEALDTLRTHLFVLARELLVTGLTAGWVVLWGLTVRLHYIKGDVLDAALTTLVFVLPAVGLFAWRLTRKVERERIPTPAIG